MDEASFHCGHNKCLRWCTVLIKVGKKLTITSAYTHHEQKETLSVFTGWWHVSNSATTTSEHLFVFAIFSMSQHEVLPCWHTYPVSDGKAEQCDKRVMSIFSGHQGSCERQWERLWSRNNSTRQTATTPQGQHSYSQMTLEFGTIKFDFLVMWPIHPIYFLTQRGLTQS